MTTPEGKVTAAIKKFLEDLRRRGAPIFFVKIAGGNHQAGGLPDWHITYNGRSVWVEVKRPGFVPPEKATRQGNNLRKIRNAGGVAAYVTSVEEVASILRRIDNGG